MFAPALRTTLAIGLVLSAMSNAEAGGRSAAEVFPTLADLPSGGPASAAKPPAVAPAASPVAPPAKPEATRTRSGRRTRLARATPAGVSAAREVAADKAGLRPSVSAFAEVAPSAGEGHPALPAGQEPAARTPAEARPAEGQAVEAPSPTLATLIAKHAAAAGVPVGLAQAVVRIESRGNARASHAGALGLMQIKAATARAAGFVGSAAGLLDADTNLHFGMKVLADAYRGANGDVCRALMKYQSGHLATRMTSANRTYCTRARAIMAGA